MRIKDFFIKNEKEVWSAEYETNYEGTGLVSRFKVFGTEKFCSVLPTPFEAELAIKSIREMRKESV